MSTKTNTSQTTEDTIQGLCELQRKRISILKSRIMIENRTISTVATFLGFATSMEEEERKARFDEARKIIELVNKEKELKDLDQRQSDFIKSLVGSSYQAVDGFQLGLELLEKDIVKSAKLLPIADWVQETDQRGFGLKSFGIIIGETGNISNYPNPAKLWSRMGCAPYQSKGETLAGATWKSRTGNRDKNVHKLSTKEWEDYGYSPRRRSVMYVIGECLLKLNKGSYRKRYLESKKIVMEKNLNNPDWKMNDCEKCAGEGCDKCLQFGKKCARAHNHGMLLMSKLLLKNLWIEWTNAVGLRC